jgi:NADPH2 dehydrogenase
MRMSDTDIVETFAALFKRIRDAYPDLAYAHVIQPRISGAADDAGSDQGNDSDDFLRALWAPRAYIAAGGFDAASARSRADATGDLVAFGRMFLSNVSSLSLDQGSRAQHLDLPA